MKELHQFMLCLFAGALIGAGSTWAAVSPQLQSDADDYRIERARFMLECTQDWMLAPEQCAALLTGDETDLPQRPPGC